MTSAEVWLWGTQIGAVALPPGDRIASFEYAPAFVPSGIELAPVTMPLGERVYRFPALALESFHGLPGLLADSLPDKYGNALIDAWLATQGRLPGDFNAVERLCYTGSRGMGALEFRPALGPAAQESEQIAIAELVPLASAVLRDRFRLHVTFGNPDRADALREILSVGTSAGGARAKAVIAWNRDTNDVRSGHVTAPEGYEYWLMKFDGVADNADHDLADPQGYGAIEFAYAQMARAAGIEMAPCRLFDEGGRRHFMTQRFDRRADGDKLHMQTLGAMAHLDYNAPRSHSYEQAFTTMRQLRLPHSQIAQQFRRMLFNIIARNQDDHVKNIAFLMDRDGVWRLAPAYDVCWSYNPAGDWTSQHQMSLNGKRDGFAMADLTAGGVAADLSGREVRGLVREVSEVVSRWREFGAEAGVRPMVVEAIAESLRLGIAGA
ncbi:MAG: type II toxin-antitoxin system HipA family toxin [Gemmatimonadaceae bacterium]|nr:type II toxin-antitoxin system HipA family toxin [Gemmatimonadaceae bacterium]